MTFARDTAAATIEAEKLNAELPPGVEPITIGDLLRVTSSLAAKGYR